MTNTSKQLHLKLVKPSLTTIFKSLVRPHVDYGDIIFDKAYTEDSNLFNTRHQLAMTGPTKGLSTDTLYQELGLESLQNTRSFENFASFTKFLKNSPKNVYLT